MPAEMMDDLHDVQSLVRLPRGLSHGAGMIRRPIALYCAVAAQDSQSPSASLPLLRYWR
jgi:hypothetical protein